MRRVFVVAVIASLGFAAPSVIGAATAAAIEECYDVDLHLSRKGQPWLYPGLMGDLRAQTAKVKEAKPGATYVFRTKTRNYDVVDLGPGPRDLVISSEEIDEADAFQVKFLRGAFDITADVEAGKLFDGIKMGRFTPKLIVKVKVAADAPAASTLELLIRGEMTDNPCRPDTGRVKATVA